LFSTDGSVFCFLTSSYLTTNTLLCTFTNIGWYVFRELCAFFLGSRFFPKQLRQDLVYATVFG
jgi:hypothetical protein